GWDIVRCIGCAVVGAVRVAGGAEYVMLPRLPIEEPPPARAMASPGARARDSATTEATAKPVRFMVFCSFTKMPHNMGNNREVARGYRAGDHAPAIVSPSTRTVGASVPRRNRRSLAGVMLGNISLRFPAIVISATGSAIAPSRIMNPAA